MPNIIQYGEALRIINADATQEGETLNIFVSETPTPPTPPTPTPEGSFDIKLYENSAEVNRVDKLRYLVDVGTLSGALREECSMLTPSIVYQSSDVPTFNYVYIPIFNRYYFVTSLSSVSKNVWRMELNCDVLMSYKTEILLLRGTIRRQENDFNPLLIDDMLPTQNDSEVEIINIPSNAFRNQLPPTNVRNFVLTTVLSQGGSSNG